jgi:hypothetical protein
MSDYRPIDDSTSERIERAAFEDARSQGLEPDDIRDSFTDRVQPAIFAEQLEAHDDLSAADVSDAVWGGIERAYTALVADRYDA